jgi:hypothetical protein
MKADVAAAATAAATAAQAFPFVADDAETATSLMNLVHDVLCHRGS